MISQPG